MKDLGSINGTYLNGTRLSPEAIQSEPFELHDGDNLVGRVILFDDFGGLVIVFLRYRSLPLMFSMRMGGPLYTTRLLLVSFAP